jgi:putative hemolysin
MAAIELALLFALIILNGFFAMSELAIVSARRVRLQQRADSGSHGARIALELSDEPMRFLSTVQIGITLIGILAGALGGATIAEQFAARLTEYGVPERAAEPLALGVVVLTLTFLSLVIGELVPKRFALAHADAIASRVAPAINLVARITHPAVVILQWSTEALLRLFGMRAQKRTAVTDEEINALIRRHAARRHPSGRTRYGRRSVTPRGAPGTNDHDPPPRGRVARCCGYRRRRSPQDR